MTNKTYLANFNIGDTITSIDGASNALTTIPVGIIPSWLALNPLTETIYVPNLSNTDNTVVILNPDAIQSIPLITQLQGVTDAHTLSGYALFATMNRSPSFIAYVTSAYSPLAPPPTALYYQLDTAQGLWQHATANKPAGSNPGGYSLSFSGVPLGVHTVFAFATYGEEGTR